MSQLKYLPVEGFPVVSQPFGRTVFASQNPDLYSACQNAHPGIDFAVDVGTDLLAVCAGKILHVGDAFGADTSIVLERKSDGALFVYGHINDANVRVGTSVRAGEVIGRSGYPPAPHLHFEYRPTRSTARNPARLFLAHKWYWDREWHEFEAGSFWKQGDITFGAAGHPAWEYTDMFKDIRSQMVTSTWQHPLRARSEGIVVHYAAGSPQSPRYNDERSFVHLLREYGLWHIRNIGNDSIAYEYAIDKFGNAYTLRDERVSWHCGNAWGNTYACGIVVPIGNNEQPSEAQKNALLVALDVLTERWNLPKTKIFLHRELSITACPGAALTDIITEYRNSPVLKLAHKPGWYRVVHNGVALIRQEPSTKSPIVMLLPSGHHEYIDVFLAGERVRGSKVWAHCGSGAGFIHISGLEEATDDGTRGKEIPSN